MSSNALGCFIMFKRGAPCVLTHVEKGSRVQSRVQLYQQIVCGNIANQIHGFTIDYGKFILIAVITVIGGGYR